MKPQHILSPLRRRQRTLLQIVLLTSLLAACAVGLATSSAQQSQEEEREFKSTIPEHVPIKVKLKNEQSFKRMKNKNWAREMEIEVKNTGSKPIYYLYVIIVMPDVLTDGNAMSLRTAYGRKQLAFLETPLEMDDVPIQPGESITLKLRERQARAYEQWRDTEKRHDPKKIEVEIQAINFGDGTGFSGRQGRPDRAIKKSSNMVRPKGESRECTPAPNPRATDLSGEFFKSFDPSTPARTARESLTTHARFSLAPETNI